MGSACIKGEREEQGVPRRVEKHALEPSEPPRNREPEGGARTASAPSLQVTSGLVVGTGSAASPDQQVAEPAAFHQPPAPAATPDEESKRAMAEPTPSNIFVVMGASVSSLAGAVFAIGCFCD